MKAILATLLFACALVAPTVVRTDDLNLPNPALTPGRILSNNETAVCVTGYSRRVRDVTIEMKRRVFGEYHIRYVRGRYEVDHLIPLSLGGSNSIQNLWPESRNTLWSANAKDHLEDVLHRMVCHGHLSLPQAQHQIATNWIDAYKRYIGPAPDNTPLVKNERW